MKKIYFIATAIAALAMTSCAQDEVVEKSASLDVPVAFSPYSANAARSATIDVAGLAQQHFGVYALYTGNDDVDLNTHTLNFMNNEEVSGTLDGEAYSWTYSPIKYWPNNDGDKVSFYAYAPYNRIKAGDAVAPTWTAGELPVVINSDVTKHIDILGCPAHPNKTKPAVGAKITFAFTHATAQLNLYSAVSVENSGNAIGGTLAAGTTITITKVTVGGNTANGNDGFYTDGNLNLVTGVLEDGRGNQALVWDDTKLQNVQYTDAVASGYRLLNANEAIAMVIPNENLTVPVTVKYTVATVDLNNEKNNSIVENVITRNVSLNPTANKIHNIRILLGMTDVDITASVSDWTDLDTPLSDVNVPANK